MSDERRVSPRWPVSATVQITLNNMQYDTLILNVNLGGCFLQGLFGAQINDYVQLSSAHNVQMNGLRGRICWIVDDPNLKGIGISFEPMDDMQKFDLIKWFNSMVPGRGAPQRAG